MKDPSVSLRALLWVLVGGLLCLMPASAQHFSLIKQEPVRSAQALDAGYHQEAVTAPYEPLSGVLLTSRADRSLQFALLDENGSLQWRKPARSTWVVVSEGARRVALVGKTEGEGYGPGLGKTIFEGVDVFDGEGRLVYRMEDTGPIGEASFSPSGALLLSTASDLRLYDPDGSLQWVRAAPPDEVQFAGEGAYVTARTWNRQTNTYTLELLQSTAGTPVKTWHYTSADERTILFVNPVTRQLLMSEYTGGASQDVVLYDMGTWQPAASIKGLSGSPFSSAWNAADNGFALLLARTTTASSREIQLGFWDLDDRSWQVQSLSEASGGVGRIELRVDAVVNQYQVRTGSTVSVYRRLR